MEIVEREGITVNKPRTHYRVHLIYIADGMVRPLSARQDVPAYTCREALEVAERRIETAYASGFKTLTWTVENRDKKVWEGDHNDGAGNVDMVNLAAGS